MRMLQGHVREKIKLCDAANQYLWPELLEPGSWTGELANMYSMGTPEEMLLTLNYCCLTWTETPHAIVDLTKARGGRHRRRGA